MLPKSAPPLVYFYQQYKIWIYCSPASVSTTLTFAFEWNAFNTEPKNDNKQPNTVSIKQQKNDTNNIFLYAVCMCARVCSINVIKYVKRDDNEGHNEPSIIGQWALTIVCSSSLFVNKNHSHPENGYSTTLASAQPMRAIRSDWFNNKIWNVSLHKLARLCLYVLMVVAVVSVLPCVRANVFAYGMEQSLLLLL